MILTHQDVKHFASGVNSPGDARGLAGSFRHFGITATDMPAGLIEEVELYAVTMQRLFVDTGAFSEVEFGATGPVVARPITESDWEQILALQARCARAYGKRCYLVAPDRVGCQATTLARMATYADRVRDFAALGAQIIVPVQKGDLPMSEMFRSSIAILGINDAIAGVPMKKDATSLDDLRELVSSLPEFCRIHLLGLGPVSPRWAATMELILSLRPNADVTSDSVTIRRLVGRTNGPKGGPRILTQLLDKVGPCNPIGRKATAIAWQGAHELGLSESEAIMLRSDYRIEIDEAANARHAMLRAMQPVQLKLVWSAA